MWFQDFANSLLLELQLPNKPLPRQKPSAETFSDTPLPGLAYSPLNSDTCRKKYGHTNLAVMFQIEFWSSLLTLYASSQVYNVTQEITRNCVFHKSSAKVS